MKVLEFATVSLESAALDTHRQVLRISFSFLLLFLPGLMSLSLPAAEPFFVGASTGFKTGKGPVWMTIDIADADKDTLRVVLAKVAYKKIEGYSDYVDILSADIANLRFKAGELAQPFHFIWQMPAEFLEQDLITLSFQLQVSDATKTSPVFEFVERDINLKALREKSWIRTIQGGNENFVVTFNPGNFLRLKYKGAGLSAVWGYAPNMGKVEVTESGNVIPGSPFDLYPPGIRADQFPTQAGFTQYNKTRLMAQEQRNRDFSVEIKLLTSKNAKSLFTGFALQALHYEIYERNLVTVTEREVPILSPDIRLYSTPDPFDASYFMKFFELGLGVTKLSKARMSTDAIQEEWPAGVIGYRVESGKWGEPLQSSDIISARQYSTSGWDADRPYRFKLSGLSDLGLAGAPVMDSVLFKLSAAQEVILQSGPVLLKSGGLEVSVSSAEASASGSAVEWAVLENQDKFPMFSMGARILVLQNVELASTVEVQMTSTQASTHSIYALAEDQETWAKLDTSAGSWKSKSRVFVFESKTAEQLAQENSKLPGESSGGGGGGCLITKPTIKKN